MHRNEYDAAERILQNTASEIGAREVVGDTKIAKVSIVGVGMRSHAGVASRMFEALPNTSNYKTKQPSRVPKTQE